MTDKLNDIAAELHSISMELTNINQTISLLMATVVAYVIFNIGWRIFG